MLQYLSEYTGKNAWNSKLESFTNIEQEEDQGDQGNSQTIAHIGYISKKGISKPMGMVVDIKMNFSPWIKADQYSSRKKAEQIGEKKRKIGFEKLPDADFIHGQIY